MVPFASGNAMLPLHTQTDCGFPSYPFLCMLSNTGGEYCFQEFTLSVQDILSQKVASLTAEQANCPVVEAVL